tara:strand:- start:69 stop:467 length:399 start_codon:yes stop_codon:yes gene_type:complete
MEANDYQIGGNHYNNKEYQHWDMVCDTGLHYLLACATKYISRWREKNGIEDLKKPSHYLVKADELGITAPTTQLMKDACVKFCAQLHPSDAAIITHMCNNEYQIAMNLISDLVIGHTCVDKGEASASYVNQD